MKDMPSQIDKELSKTERLKALEQEKLRILAETDAVKGEQLFITLAGNLERQNELRQFALGNIEDPERKYEVYYNGIQKLLLTHLPKGSKHKTARNYIQEEKNTYLTRGKRINRAGKRGADGRMGHVADADDLMKVVMDWIIANGTMVELFNTLRELNISKGYGTRQF